jgi:hypothetical protein
MRNIEVPTKVYNAILEEFPDDNAPWRSHAGKSNWLHACILDNKKKPLPILANALIGLRAELPDAFTYDEMACVQMLMKPLKG